MRIVKCVKRHALVVALTTVLSPISGMADSVTIPIGRSEVVEVAKDMSEVVVADSDIADAYVHGKRRVSIAGKRIGKTDVRILSPNGVLRDIDVTIGYDLPAIRKALSDFLPNQDIGVKMLNTNLVLIGTVSDSAAAQRAVQIAGEFTRSAMDDGNAGGNAADEESASDSKVINMLEVNASQQVLLKVRVGEIRRTAIKNLGVDLQAVKTGGESIFSLGTGGGISAFREASDLDFGQFSLPEEGVRGFASGSRLNSSGDGIAGLLQALERNNLFKVLAEPNLVALSGETAQFLAGGEFPVPVPQGGIGQQGNITVEFKPFGVSVKFTPFVLAENRIRIAVEPEVSEINNDNALELNDIQIPSFTTRRAQTIVELSPGESFMIAGLIQDELASRVDNVPGIKQMPILGALFSSVSYQREETELVLVVTPHLVDPILSSEAKLPTDDFQAASLMEMMFFGAVAREQRIDEHSSQVPEAEGPVGFMVD